MSMSISIAPRAEPAYHLSINGENVSAKKEQMKKQEQRNGQISYEETLMENFKEENSLQNQRVSEIYTKFLSGRELSEEELDYLAKNNPNLYKEVKEVLMERKAMEIKMKLAKTKEQVHDVHIKQALNIKATMGEGKQAETNAEKNMARANHLTDAYNRYTASIEYRNKDDASGLAEKRKEMVRKMNSNIISNNEANVQEAYAKQRTSKVTGGKTIGNPKLSEKAQKYYDELKKKFGDMEFILVSPDKKEQAEANAGAFASPNKTVVLIDTEKIEKMAEDENYREKYEGIINNARNQLAQMQTSISSTNTNVKSYGIKINDGGTASFFAVIDKSLADQKERIEKKAEEKAAKKRADKKEQLEKAEEKKKKEAADREKVDTVTITASSIEELMQKINDYAFMQKSDKMETEEEKVMGRNINFSV